MIRKVILDGTEVPELVPASLPMLIHGEEGYGASLYTIALAAKWFLQGYKVSFLCGYPMAHEEFLRMVGDGSEQAKFFTKEKSGDFLAEIKVKDDRKVIFIKNIELFDASVYKQALTAGNVIISGDVGKSSLKEIMLNQEFVTKVYFSSLPGIIMPNLNRYEGLVVSGDYQGITKLE